MCEIVSFEIAKKLKEKGFYYKCFATYDKDGMLGYNYVQPEKPCAIGFDDCLCSNNIEDNGCIDAPTISQVLKWLREEKKMFVQISLFQYCYDYCILDTEMVYYDNEHKVLHQGPTGYSYNEAALAGIEYVLDNLI